MLEIFEMAASSGISPETLLAYGFAAWILSSDKRTHRVEKIVRACVPVIKRRK